MGEAYEIAETLLKAAMGPDGTDKFDGFHSAAAWVKRILPDLGYQMTDNVAGALVYLMTKATIACEEVAATAEIMRRAAYQQSDPLWGAF